MRLPHRNTQSLSLFVFCIVLALILPARARTREQLVSNPSSLNFHSVQVGQTATQVFVLTNSGSSPATVSAINVNNSVFTISGATLPVVVAAGQSISLSLTFAPTASTFVGGHLWVQSTASNSTLKISVQGTGVTNTTGQTGQLSVTPSTLNLGSVVVGSSATASGTLSATGTSVTINAAGSSNSAFKLTGLSLPTTIPAGQSVPFTVTYSPTATGSTSATVSFTSNAQAATTTESVSGTGTAAVGQLTVSPASVSFGSVVVGSSSSASGTLSAAGASVTINSDTTTNAGFKVGGLSLPVTIPAGQSVPFTVTYSPTATGSTSATVSFTSNAQAATTTESVSGTGTAAVGQLTVSPASVSFGSVVVGSSSSASGTLSAAGASVTINSDTTTNTGFKVSGLSLPVTIPAGQSVPFTVTYSPTATGSTSATLSFTSNAQTATTTESLSGTGTAQSGQLTISPATLTFGNVNLGSSATGACTLSASGAAVTVNSAALGNSQFALSGASFPMTLAAGQSAQISIIFSPTASGNDSGTLTLSSNASNSTVAEALSGVGIAVQYSVSLNWDASTSSVAGYNIYRGTNPGSYSKINPTLDANTAFTDSTVVSGVTYYYAATAVNSSGQESAYSTPLEVAVP